MKSFLRAAAATGVAAATVVTGLSFGPAAMAASPDAAEIPIGTKGVPFKLLADVPGYPAVSRNSYTGAEAYNSFVRLSGSLSEAREKSPLLTPTFAGTYNGKEYWTLSWDYTTTGGVTEERCVSGGGPTNDSTILAAGIALCRDRDRANVQWTIDNGILRNRDGYYMSSTRYTYSTTRYQSLQTPKTRPSSTKFVDLPSKIVALGADVTNVDLVAKTASLSNGTAQDDATSVKVSYTDNTDTAREFTAAASGGKWSQALDKLKLGNNKVNLESYKGTEKLADNVIDVDLVVPAVKVDGAWKYPKDGETKFAYRISGGTPGAGVFGVVPYGTQQQLGTIGADGTAYIVDSPYGPTNTKWEIRQQFEGQFSKQTDIALADFVADKLPTVQINSATKFTMGDKTYFSYEITGAPGATVQDRPENGQWADLGKIPESGVLKVNSTLRGPTSGKWEFRQTAGTTVSEAVQLAASDYKPTPVGATVKNVDVEAGTAELDGFAPANATDVAISYTNKDGASRTKNTTVVDGVWSKELDLLALGKTEVQLVAYEGSEEVAKSTVEVDLPVIALTGVAAFSDDVQDVATITGTATPDTQISAFHGESTKPVATVMSNAKGEYVLPINPPGIGGPYDLTITQKIRGEETSPLPITLEYGQGVEITTPAQDEPVEAGEPLFITGKAQGGTMVQVTEKGVPDKVLGQANAGQNGTYRVQVPKLQDREYTLVVSAQSKGANVTSAELRVNPGKSDVAAPTAEVTFDADVTKKATVSGTGVDGATITVKNGDTEIGEATVRDGEWSTEIDPIGAGSYELGIEQTGIEGTQSTTATADFGAAVAVTTPAGEVAPGLVPVSGTGQDGARVTVTAAGKTATTTVEDGTWSTEIEIAPGTTAVKVEAAQQSKGALRTTASVDLTPAGAIEAKDVVITTPSDNTFVPGQTTTVGGTATPFADIDIRFQWNDTVVARAKADAEGNWSYNRQYAAGVRYQITATQKRVDGTTSVSNRFDLSEDGAQQQQDVAITTPANHAFTPLRTTTVSGTASPNAKIDIRFQWNDTVVASTTADSSGNWSYNRQYAAGVTYQITATQTREDGTTSVSPVWTISDETARRPLFLGTPEKTSTFVPNEAVLFSGTGTPGATIVVTAPKFNDAVVFTTTVNTNGEWTFKRGFAAGVEYDLTLTQTTTDGTTDKIEGVQLTPAS